MSLSFSSDAISFYIDAADRNAKCVSAGWSYHCDLRIVVDVNWHKDIIEESWSLSSNAFKRRRRDIEQYTLRYR